MTSSVASASMIVGNVLTDLSNRIPWYYFAIGGTGLLVAAKTMSDTALALKEKTDMALIAGVCNVPLSLHDWERLKKSDKWPRPKTFGEKVSNLRKIAAPAAAVPAGLLSLATGAALLINEKVPDEQAKFWTGVTVGTSLVGAKVLFSRWLFNNAANKLHPIIPLSFNSPICREARDIHGGMPAREPAAAPIPIEVEEPARFGLPDMAPVPVRSPVADAALVTVAEVSVLAMLWTLTVDAVAGLLIVPFPESTLHSSENPGT